MGLMARRHILIQSTMGDDNILDDSDRVLSKFIDGTFNTITLKDSSASDVIRNACSVIQGKSYTFTYTADSLNSTNERTWIVTANGNTIAQNIMTNKWQTGTRSYTFTATVSGALWITIDKGMTNMKIVKQ